MLLALGMLIAPQAAAQPADASSSNVGRFYAFGGFAVFAPDKDSQLRGQQGNLANLIAGGGLRHGQVIGSTEADGGYIKERPVTPGDLAATIYQHMGVPLDATYTDATGRPRFIVEQGSPVAELF